MRALEFTTLAAAYVLACGVAFSAGLEIGRRHGAYFSPRKPRNATQSFCGALRA
ncbi:MAG: hypothetical protein V4669_13880 [Pseudomonadota bacterium]